jgi:hypothetical protein
MRDSCGFARFQGNPHTSYGGSAFCFWWRNFSVGKEGMRSEHIPSDTLRNRRSSLVRVTAHIAQAVNG